MNNQQKNLQVPPINDIPANRQVAFLKHILISILILLIFRFVPESLHWLLATNRTQRAVVVLKTVVKFNKLTIFESDDSTEENMSSVQQLLHDHGTLIDCSIKQICISPDCNSSKDFKLKKTTTQKLLIDSGSINKETCQKEPFELQNTTQQKVPIEFNYCTQQNKDLCSKKLSGQNMLQEANVNDNTTSIKMNTCSVSTQDEEEITNNVGSEERLDVNGYKQKCKGIKFENHAVSVNSKNSSDKQPVSVGSDYVDNDVCEVKSSKMCKDSAVDPDVEKSACGLFRLPKMRLYTIVVFYLL